MTKRQALLAALAATVGAMSNKLNAVELPKEEIEQWGKHLTNGTMASVTLQPMYVAFPLDSYRAFTFTCGKDSITMTPAEIMAALLS